MHKARAGNRAKPVVLPAKPPMTAGEGIRLRWKRLSLSLLYTHCSEKSLREAPWGRRSLFRIIGSAQAVQLLWWEKNMAAAGAQPVVSGALQHSCSNLKDQEVETLGWNQKVNTTFKACSQPRFCFTGLHAPKILYPSKTSPLTRPGI